MFLAPVQVHSRIVKQWKDLEAAGEGTIKNRIFRYEMTQLLFPRSWSSNRSHADERVTYALVCLSGLLRQCFQGKILRKHS